MVFLSVCLSVCLMVMYMSPAKTAELIETLMGGRIDSGGLKEPCIRWTSRNRQFLMVVWPIEKTCPCSPVVKALGRHVQ